MQNNIVEKIRKLLNLASENSNENESRSALLKAQRLMAENSLTEKEIVGGNKQEIEVLTVSSSVKVGKSTWRSHLGGVFADNHRCYCFLRGSGNEFFVTFMGEKTDVEICLMSYEYAVDVVERELNNLRNTYRREGRSFRMVGNSYGINFSLGLDTAFKEQREEHQEWGLILSVPQEVVNEFNNLNTKASKSKAYVNGDDTLKEKAFNDGREFANRKKSLGA